MDCFCGCGRRVGRQDVKVNLQAGQVAMELLVWDKARVRGYLDPEAAEDAERLVARGGECYQRMIRHLHGEREVYDFEEGERWVSQSEAARRERPEMTRKGNFLTRDRVQLSEDELAQLDRTRPELTFSGRAAPAGRGETTVDRLERLAALHASGALTDAEFAAAKSRVTAGED